VSDSSPAETPPQLTLTQWLIVSIAALGFAFDIYELLMMPLIARPALEELLQVDRYTDSGNRAILAWTGYIMYGSAISGGIFGLLGGYLTDRFGRRRVLVWSILLYAFSALAAGFSTSALMLLVLRCTTFIGVCVEFVAAVAWLAELFPNPRQREAVLGYTQAFSSVGGLLVTAAYLLVVQLRMDLPAIYGEHAAWRYTLISGVIPALPLIVIRPFLPESPAWQSRRAAGTLQRPSFAALFQPALARTTLVTAAMFACAYGAAFGALQLTPQIVPGLVPELPELVKVRRQYEAAQQDQQQADQLPKLKARAEELSDRQESVVGGVQLYQELGGLLGRFALAWLALRIASRRTLLRIFQLPGLVLIPLVYLLPAAGNLPAGNLEVLRVGIFLAGFLTVAQFSFWGNYLPLVYPTYLRGTGEGFAANVGGRMIGTAANPLTTIVVAPLVLSTFSGLPRPAGLAYAAAAVAFLVYGVGSLLTFWLPEPKQQALLD
jgi:MFS family permease